MPARDHALALQNAEVLFQFVSQFFVFVRVGEEDFDGFSGFDVAIRQERRI